jgi:hypothetical protein
MNAAERIKRISSFKTRFYKKSFPVIWFGLMLLIAAEILYLYLYADNKPPVLVMIIPLEMAVIGLMAMKMLLWNLADEVWDAGDRLTVVKGKDRRDIALSSILNVSHSTFTNPAHVRLTLKGANRDFDEVVFCPVTRPRDLFDPMHNSIAQDLLRRIHGAKGA